MPSHRSPRLRAACTFVGVMLFSSAPACAATDAMSAPATLSAVPLVGHPCEGCEAAFEGVPAVIADHLTLVAAAEPGAPMRIEGRVVDRSGQPVPGVVLYVHQTDAGGRYPAMADAPGRAAARHGRLRGWVRSGADGSWRIDTIRPGGYPGTAIPEHVHVQVIEPGCATYYIDDLMFRDDPRLTADAERSLVRGTGGDGVVMPVRVDGVWQVRRDIVIGRAVPAYPDCGRG